MSKHRLEAYTDAVIAIILTIMVLEFKIPHDHSRHALFALWPVLLSYIMSFVFLSIYRNNHHHMLQAAKSVNGSVLRANNGLLFFLSLIPFATGWMAENHFAATTVMLYGILLLCCGVAYYLLARTLFCANSHDAVFWSLKGNRKWERSIVLYAFWIAMTFVHPWISLGIYGFVSLIWIIPSKKIEEVLWKE